MTIPLRVHTAAIVLAVACTLATRAATAAADDSTAVRAVPPAAAQDTTAAAPAPGAAVTFPGTQVRRWQVGLLRPDRMQHASLSMTLALAIGVISRQPAAGAAASFACGVAKELWDTRTTGFDAADLAADATGAAVGAFATHAIEY